MPDPEIDRRCTTCGASVRSRALFCPQCGQPIPNQSEPVHDHESNTTTTHSAPTVRLVRDAAPDPSETQPLKAIPDLSETQPLSVAAQTVLDQSAATKHPNLQRATNVARGLEENVLGRVDKIRKASSVVIDQAAYDPSLRFILVAAALFLLFLFLLILSKVLG
jgi:hypothetical protein